MQESNLSPKRARSLQIDRNPSLQADPIHLELCLVLHYKKGCSRAPQGTIYSILFSRRAMKSLQLLLSLTSTDLSVGVVQAHNPGPFLLFCVVAGALRFVRRLSLCTKVKKYCQLENSKLKWTYKIKLIFLVGRGLKGSALQFERKKFFYRKNNNFIRTTRR